MIAMSQQRDELNELVQRLPEQKLAEAIYALQSIEDDAEVDLADEMPPEELAEFEAHMARSYDDMRAGRVRPASEILRELDEQ